MKATTFVSGHHQRIAQRLGELHGERAACLPAMAEVVEEVLSLIAIEEDLFYPALSKLPPSTLPPARLSSVRGELAGVDSSLHGLLGATDATFGERVGALEDVLRRHAEADQELFALAEGEMDPAVLDDLGARMERFYAGSVVAAHRAPPRRSPA